MPLSLEIPRGSGPAGHSSSLRQVREDQQSRRRLYVKTAVFLFLFSSLTSSLVLGQSFQGSLRGRIIDPNGAATPAAKVTITDDATSTARSTITNEQGVYDFFAVVPATFTVGVEAPGFRRLERKGVVISTQANVTLDLSLEIGEISSKVNVTAEAPSLDAADATTGQLIDNHKITDLPLLGRNPYFEGQLAQGVVYAANPEFHRMQDQNGNSQVSIAGGPLRTNNISSMVSRSRIPTTAPLLCLLRKRCRN
jgi:hypothetical protein